jgi:hypothetical protein
MQKMVRLCFGSVVIRDQTCCVEGRFCFGAGDISALYPRRQEEGRGVGGGGDLVGGALVPPHARGEPRGGDRVARVHIVELVAPAAEGPSVKVTGLAQKLGQLEAVHRDFQSKHWANLNLLGQPCNFYAPGSAGRAGGRPPPW